MPRYVDDAGGTEFGLRRCGARKSRRDLDGVTDRDLQGHPRSAGGAGGSLIRLFESEKPPEVGLLNDCWTLYLGAPRRDFQKRVQETSSATLSDKNALQRWEAIDTSSLHELNRSEVDTLLRKVRAVGVRALTPDERAFLDRMTTRH